MKSLEHLHYSDVTPAQLDALLHRGRHLRAEMFAQWLHAPKPNQARPAAVFTHGPLASA